jgi:NADH-quinone oxidoreductase subunit N
MNFVTVAAAHHLHGPHIDWTALAPFIAITAGALLVLLIGLIGDTLIRERVAPLLAVITLGTAIAFLIAHFHYIPHVGSKPGNPIIAGAMTIDELGTVLDLIFCVSALATVIMSLRTPAPKVSGHGEYNALLLFSVLGMMILVSSVNLITLFVGFELLSIPLYVLCATEMRREHSLESGLKYLIIGSVGSATLLYGLALIYGATGATDFGAIAEAIANNGLSGDVLLLTGVALCVAGLAFKTSVAPFHQWTPDVYEGAPTPITAFMAVATKVAALGVFLRLFDVALIGAQQSWGPALATLAAVTIVVGNVGALGQSSLKRMLAYSSVGQAGYMLAGVVVATQLGVRATVFYLAVYLFMNMAAFAVIVARERETDLGDSIHALAGLGRERPYLAWPMTLSMLGLAGIPATAGFMGKFYLIDAAVSGSYTWLGVAIVVGSMISLGYYLPVIAAMWMGSPISDRSPSAEAQAAATTLAGIPPASGGALPAIAGGSPELEVPVAPVARHAPAPQPEVALVAILAGAATLFFGIVPQPLFDLVRHAGSGLGLF